VVSLQFKKVLNILWPCIIINLADEMKWVKGPSSGANQFFLIFRYVLRVSLVYLVLQCVEGKPVLEFSRVRLLRSGLVGFCLHGSLSHYYYYVCEVKFNSCYFFDIIPDQCVMSCVFLLILHVVVIFSGTCFFEL